MIDFLWWHEVYAEGTLGLKRNFYHQFCNASNHSCQAQHNVLIVTLSPNNKSTKCPKREISQRFKKNFVGLATDYLAIFC